MSTPRTVVVTGGSRGLGAGIVEEFLRLGDRVATCSRSTTAETDAWAADPALAGRFLHRPVDLVDPAACETFVKEVRQELGDIDVLVNNAGIAREGVLGLFRDDAIDEVVDLNIKGTLYVTRPVVRAMLRRGSGSIVNISSVVGLNGYRGLAAYSATKAGLDAITRSLARELGGRGITVNSVAPGYLRTEMSGTLDEAQLQQITRRTPAGRLGDAQDVATVVAFLASDGARFVTGQTIVVDGGLTA